MSKRLVAKSKCPTWFQPMLRREYRYRSFVKGKKIRSDEWKAARQEFYDLQKMVEEKLPGVFSKKFATSKQCRQYLLKHKVAKWCEPVETTYL